MSEFGVHSEVGKLRKVIVHRPGLEMRRPQGQAGTRRFLRSDARRIRRSGHARP